jgi:hypothetical protein
MLEFILYSNFYRRKREVGGTILYNVLQKKMNEQKQKEGDKILLYTRYYK